jgi:hypothetical protein
VVVAWAVLSACSGDGVEEGGGQPRVKDQLSATTTVRDREAPAAAVSGTVPAPPSITVPAPLSGAQSNEVLAEVVEGRSLPERVRSCLALRVPVEPRLSMEVLGGGDGGAAAEVSLVRGCEQVVRVVDGWIGEVDSVCLLRALSEVSAEDLDLMLMYLVDPERGEVASLPVGGSIMECVA